MPTPGSPVRGSRTGRPIMALLDLLGRRWLLRITWELRDQPAGFRQLQLRCDDMSPSVLSQRLHELKEAEVLELLGDQYRLTAEGRELLTILAPLRAWATRWAQRSHAGAARAAPD
ncbi:MAG: transcriptional regulator [Acidobacteria bacterium]|nr:MAG: transcriptional regulator [Acidobacteriota bacterium]